MSDIFAYCFSGDGHAVRMEKISFCEFVHHSGNAACKTEIFHMMMAAWTELCQIRSLFTDRVKHVEIQLDARFVSDGRQMKHGVCGAGHRHVHRDGVFKGFFCENIAGTDIFSQHFHNLDAGSLCQTDSLAAVAEGCSIVRKTHAENLGQTVHTVCCVHTGAGTAGRARIALEIIDVFLCHGSGSVGADCLEHARKTSLLAFYVTGKHRAAADKYGRNIDSCCCHQKTRYVFITVRDTYHQTDVPLPYTRWNRRSGHG